MRENAVTAGAGGAVSVSMMQADPTNGYPFVLPTMGKMVAKLGAKFQLLTGPIMGASW